MKLIKDRVKVEWVELGEGWDGDYDPDDPNDTELLRFDISIYDPKHPEAYEDGWACLESYCTQFPIETSAELQLKGLEYIMDFVYEPLMDGFDVKRIAEQLSWISPETVEEKTDGK